MKLPTAVPADPPRGQSFHARWRCGRLDWICPNCGTIRRSMLTTWIIECRSCGNVFGLNLTACKLRRGPGSRGMPPDFYVPLGDMMRVEVMPERYRRGDPAHRLIE